MDTELDRRRFAKVCSSSALGTLTCGLSDTLVAAAADPPPVKSSYDCIVLGLGAMVSACLYQLANGSLLAIKICMYTHGGPWLDHLPGQKNVSFVAACNGGGFKFSSVYGEALADLATVGRTDLPIGFMSFQ